jgi:tellurite resistance protein
LIQQEVKMAEQDFQASMKETEEEINAVATQTENAESVGKPGQT